MSTLRTNTITTLDDSKSVEVAQLSLEGSDKGPLLYANDLAERDAVDTAPLPLNTQLGVNDSVYKLVGSSWFSTKSFREWSLSLEKFRGEVPNIVFFGDSILYGQDFAGPNPPKNGSTQPVSSTPPITEFTDEVADAGMAASVLDYTFPGDTVALALSRWETELDNLPTSSMCFVMYGHNDANDYGGYGTTTLTWQFADNLDILVNKILERNCIPVILGPPPVQDVDDNTNIRPYSEAAKSVAQSHGIPFFDTFTFLAGYNGLYTDNVHLTPGAYSILGRTLASLVVNGGHVAEVGVGRYPIDAVLGRVVNGSVISSPDAILSDGKALRLQPGGKAHLCVHTHSGVSPRVHANVDTGTPGVPLKYSLTYEDGLAAKADLYVGNTFENQSLVGRPLKPGLHVIKIENESSDVLHVNGVSFEDPEAGHICWGDSFPSKALSNLFRPRGPGRQVAWFSAIDTSKPLQDRYNLTSYLTLSDTGLQGIVLWVGGPLTNEVMTNHSILIFRSGTDLLIRELVADPFSQNDQTVASVFPTGNWSGELEVERDPSTGDLTIRVDGATEATFSPATIDTSRVFPGIICENTSGTYVVHSTLVRGVSGW